MQWFGSIKGFCESINIFAKHKDVLVLNISTRFNSEHEHGGGHFVQTSPTFQHASILNINLVEVILLKPHLIQSAVSGMYIYKTAHEQQCTTTCL
jgi:hypothetical protein